MTTDPLDNKPRELSRRWKLSPEEAARLRAWLEAHPGERAEAEMETALNRALDRLRDVPVASNFTARVLAAVHVEAGSKAGARSGRWSSVWRLGWLPRVALAGLALSAALASYQHFRASRQENLARSLVAVSEIASLPSLEVLKDFEVIQAIAQAPVADEELLKLMQ